MDHTTCEKILNQCGRVGKKTPQVIKEAIVELK